MRIGLVEFLLILAIASLTIGPQVALFVDRWMRRANRANARAARRRAEYAAQMAVGGTRCSSGSARPARCLACASCWRWCMHWCSGPSIRRHKATLRRMSGRTPVQHRRPLPPIIRER